MKLKTQKGHLVSTVAVRGHLLGKVLNPYSWWRQSIFQVVNSRFPFSLAWEYSSCDWKPWFKSHESRRQCFSLSLGPWNTEFQELKLREDKEIYEQNRHSWEVSQHPKAIWLHQVNVSFWQMCLGLIAWSNKTLSVNMVGAITIIGRP